MNEMNDQPNRMKYKLIIIDQHKIHIIANIESIYDFTHHCIHRIQPQLSFVVLQINS
jgi:hypothetical protein